MCKGPWGTLVCSSETPCRAASRVPCTKTTEKWKTRKREKKKVFIGGEMKTPAQLAAFNGVIALYIHEPVGKCFVTET